MYTSIAKTYSQQVSLLPTNYLLHV